LAWIDLRLRQGFKTAYESDHQPRVPRGEFHQQHAWPTEDEIAGRFTVRSEEGEEPRSQMMGQQAIHPVQTGCSNV
jgi:hypothetical protein